MLRIFLNNSFKVFLLYILIDNSAFALGDRNSDGKVEIKVQKNNLCFSVNHYKPKASFFRKQVDSNNLKLSHIGVSSKDRGYIWGIIKPINNLDGALGLDSKKCISYGELLPNYNTNKSPALLKTEQGYKVSIWSFNPEDNKAVVFS